MYEDGDEEADTKAGGGGGSAGTSKLVGSTMSADVRSHVSE